MCGEGGGVDCRGEEWEEKRKDVTVIKTALSPLNRGSRDQIVPKWHPRDSRGGDSDFCRAAQLHRGCVRLATVP